MRIPCRLTAAVHWTWAVQQCAVSARQPVLAAVCVTPVRTAWCRINFRLCEVDLVDVFRQVGIVNREKSGLHKLPRPFQLNRQPCNDIRGEEYLPCAPRNSSTH